MDFLEVISDADCNLLCANHRYLKWLGESALPDNFLPYIPAEEHPYVNRRLRAMLASRRPIITMHQCKTPAGLVYCRWIDTPVYNRLGKFRYIHSLGIFEE